MIGEGRDEMEAGSDGGKAGRGVDVSISRSMLRVPLLAIYVLALSFGVN